MRAVAGTDIEEMELLLRLQWSYLVRVKVRASTLAAVPEVTEGVDVEAMLARAQASDVTRDEDGTGRWQGLYKHQHTLYPGLPLQLSHSSQWLDPL